MEQIAKGLVTSNFFRLMGARIATGRDFTDADAVPQPGDSGILIPPGSAANLSYDYWQRRDGGSTAVLGQRSSGRGEWGCSSIPSRRGTNGIARPSSASAIRALIALPTSPRVSNRRPRCNNPTRIPTCPGAARSFLSGKSCQMFGYLLPGANGKSRSLTIRIGFAG